MADSEDQPSGEQKTRTTNQTELERLRQRVLELERERIERVPEIADVFAACPDNIIVLDTDLRIRFINWTVPDLTPAGVIGMPVYQFVPEGSRRSMRACFERVKSSARPDRYTTNYVAEDGSVSFWESRVGPVIRQGEIVGYVSISSNVTERREDAGDRDLLFNMSIDMLCVADLEGRFKSVSPAAERTLGHSIRELLERPYLEFIHPDDREKTVKAGEALTSGREVIDFENRYRAKDGSYRWLSWRAGTDPSGRVIHAVARDVTEHRNLAERLRRSARMEAVGQLAAGIAHDFNNLLLAIRGNVSFARGTGDPEERRQYLDEIESATQRAADLTRQLLAFGSRQPMHLTTFDINSQIAELVQLLRRLIPESITIDFAPGRDLSRVHADRSQIEQVVMNLCLNARDAMPRGGRLTLETQNVSVSEADRGRHFWASPGAYVYLCVADTGLGMSPEVQERVFEPFFTTKETGKGSGLGLATAYGIVKQHGGILALESALNTGTSFRVYLPATELPAEQPAERTSTAARGGKETILLAEDDEMVRTVVVRILTSAGYRVLTSKDGVEAIAMFTAHSREVSLVILDVVMPLLGGVETLSQIRELRPDIPWLLTSGYAEHSKLDAPDTSPDRILEKPYQPSELLRRVRQELD